MTEAEKGYAKTAVLVLGMHRSGTSALTRVLSLLGADLPKNLMPAGRGNDAGHWESQELADIHDALLASAATEWYDWRAFNPDWNASAAAEPFKQKMLDVLERDFAASPLFTVKDPRICRFVPIWIDVLSRFPACPVVITPLRNPMEVAGSLAHRDGFPPAKSYLLWLRHVLDAEAATRELPRAFINYEDLLGDWREAIAAVSVRARLHWPHRSDRVELEIDNFLATELRHHSSAPALLAARSDIATWVKESYETLRQMAAEGDSDAARARLDKVRAAFDAAASAFGLLLVAETAQSRSQAAAAEAQVRLKDEELARLSDDRNRLTAELEDRNRLMAEVEAAKAALAELPQLREQIGAIEQALAQARVELDAAREEAGRQSGERERLGAELQTVTVTLTERATAIARLTSELDASGASIARAEKERDSARLYLRESQAELQKLAGELDAAREEVARGTAERARMESDTLAMAREFTVVRTRVRKLQTEIESHGAAAATARDGHRAALAAHDAAFSEAARLKTRTAGLAAELATARDLAASRERRVDELSRELDAARTHATRAEAETARLHSETAETRRKMGERETKAQTEASVAARDLALARAHVSELEATIATQARHLAGLNGAGGIANGAARADRGFFRTLAVRLAHGNGAARTARRWEHEAIRTSRLFDAVWYLKRNPDVATADNDPLWHYLLHGAAEGREPHPLFDSAFYRAQAADLAESGMTPLGHYISVGVAKGLDPHPLFDTDWYLKQNPDVVSAHLNPLYHFYKIGGGLGLDPHPLFDSSWYLDQNPDVARTKDNPLHHYVVHGQKEGRATKAVAEHEAKKKFEIVAVCNSTKENKALSLVETSRNQPPSFTDDETYRALSESPLFDTNYYLSNYPDVAEANADPLLHYMDHGAAEGRNPSALFDTRWYLQQNPYVTASRVNPLMHYITEGWKEGRDPHPNFDNSYYRERYPDVVGDPLVDFIRCGWKERRDPNSSFNTAWYLKQFSAVMQTEVDPLTHYLNLPIVDRRRVDFCVEAKKRFGPADYVAGEQGGPLISILVPIFKTPLKLLDEMVASVMYQTYPNWELCVVDDGSADDAITERLNRFRMRDRRIQVEVCGENRGISAATNVALNMAHGDYVGLLDHDDLLTHDALEAIVRELREFPEAELVYSDECKIDLEGYPSDPFFKPDWSPVLLFNCMYTGHFSVYPKSLVRSVGAFRAEYDFSQDYDLALRIAERAKVIRHIPRILYAWRMISGSGSIGEKPYARISNIAALQDAAQRRGIPAKTIPLPTANKLEVARQTMKAKVSVVIPSDDAENILASIASIRKYTEYPLVEILIVTNSGIISDLQDPETAACRFVAYDKPFNFSDKCNEGAKQASGQYLIFFNDDVRVVSPDWVESLLECFSFGQIGAVAPKLLYQDDTIQHAGMVCGVRRLVGTAYHARPAGFTSIGNLTQSVREVSLLSGACLAITADLFARIGGFDAINVPSSHSDVDLCFKVREAGYSCLYTPHAVLRHIGHLSIGKVEQERTPQDKPKDKADLFLLRRWPNQISYDPYFPGPIRDSEYHDSPESFTVYPGSVVTRGDGKDILLIAHDLSRSGAPRILFELAKILSRAGHFIVVVSPLDGFYRSELNKAGITTIVDELILSAHSSVFDFARNFDLAIANTIVAWPFVRQMSNVLDVYWYLHEVEAIQLHADRNREVVEAFESAREIWAISEMTARIARHYSQRIRILESGFSPIRNTRRYVSDSSPPYKLLMLGSYEGRKGQDIVAAAALRLPQSYREKIRIQMVGRVLDEGFFQRLKSQVESIPEISLSSEVSPETALDMTIKSDIIIVPSRSDAFPLTMLDAMRAGKVVISSPNTGVVRYIENGQSGFVSKTVSPESVAVTLIEALDNANRWPEIGKRAQDLFLGDLSEEMFKKRIFEALDIGPLR